MATPAAGAGDVPQRRVQRSFKQVPDFDRDARGDVVWTSLKGPARLEASEQFAREQFVAIEEAKILREKVRRCRLHIHPLGAHNTCGCCRCTKLSGWFDTHPPNTTTTANTPDPTMLPP